MNKTYACIMAGGSGERFWPLSRAAKPKHLVRLLTRADDAGGYGASRGAGAAE